MNQKAPDVGPGLFSFDADGFQGPAPTAEQSVGLAATILQVDFFSSLNRCSDTSFLRSDNLNLIPQPKVYYNGG
jgi:hypothetical protein